MTTNHGKFLEISDHFTCFLRKLYAGQDATVRTGHGTTDWFQIGNTDQWNKIESPEMNPLTYGHLIFDKGGKNIQWRKDNLLTSGSGKTGQLLVKE